MSFTIKRGREVLTFESFADLMQYHMELQYPALAAQRILAREQKLSEERAAQKQQQNPPESTNNNNTTGTVNTDELPMGLLKDAR